MRDAVALQTETKIHTETKPKPNIGRIYTDDNTRLIQTSIDK